MEWTREMRYRKLEEVSDVEYQQLVDHTKSAKWRQNYHIQPVSGLLNDPNGFVYHDGQYHLFYQWFPLGEVHGIKYWYHVASTDLVDFVDHGIAIRPDTVYDSHGAYSGSGIVVNDEIKLVYTGNHRTEAWERIPYQIVATINDDVVTKEEPFIDGAPAGYTEHFRDPKVWQENEKYYAVIGAQRINETGTIVVYESENFSSWKLKGEMKTDYDDFGYMWECPDYFNIDGNDIVLFCPQGIAAEGLKFRNIYQSGYIIGQLDLKTLKMEHGEFTELDRGFDFYAPQTTMNEEGERLLIGWMGLPDTTYPTDIDHWAHCLTLPRVLSVIEGKLYQQPVKSLEKRRLTEERLRLTGDTLSLPDVGDVYELIIDVIENPSDQLMVDLRVSDNEFTRIEYDARSRCLSLDRTNSGQLPGQVDGTIRSAELKEPLFKLQIFVDVSSVEVFVNEGEEVFTARIFPKPISTGLTIASVNGNSLLNITKYQLREGI